MKIKEIKLRTIEGFFAIIESIKNWLAKVPIAVYLFLLANIVLYLIINHFKGRPTNSIVIVFFAFLYLALFLKAIGDNGNKTFTTIITLLIAIFQVHKSSEIPNVNSLYLKLWGTGSGYKQESPIPDKKRHDGETAKKDTVNGRDTTNERQTITVDTLTNVNIEDKISQLLTRRLIDSLRYIVDNNGINENTTKELIDGLIAFARKTGNEESEYKHHISELEANINTITNDISFLKQSLQFEKERFSKDSSRLGKYESLILNVASIVNSKACTTSFKKDSAELFALKKAFFDSFYNVRHSIDSMSHRNDSLNSIKDSLLKELKLTKTLKSESSNKLINRHQILIDDNNEYSSVYLSQSVLLISPNKELRGVEDIKLNELPDISFRIKVLSDRYASKKKASLRQTIELVGIHGALEKQLHSIKQFSIHKGVEKSMAVRIDKEFFGINNAEKSAYYERKPFVLKPNTPYFFLYNKTPLLIYYASFEQQKKKKWYNFFSTDSELVRPFLFIHSINGQLPRFTKKTAFIDSSLANACIYEKSASPISEFNLYAYPYSPMAFVNINDSFFLLINHARRDSLSALFYGFYNLPEDQSFVQFVNEEPSKDSLVRHAVILFDTSNYAFYYKTDISTSYFNAWTSPNRRLEIQSKRNNQFGCWTFTISDSLATINKEDVGK